MEIFFSLNAKIEIYFDCGERNFLKKFIFEFMHKKNVIFTEVDSKKITFLKVLMLLKINRYIPNYTRGQYK